MIRPDGVSTAVASSYTASDWAAQEAAGSVFLPAAGKRNDTSVEDTYYGGYYWSSTRHSEYESRACLVNFRASNLHTDEQLQRNYGCSVRLVKDAN